MALRLSKAGYGTPEQVLGMSTEVVLAAAEYESFLGRYEEAYIQLNKDKDK